jgi:hypothetical protein
MLTVVQICRIMGVALSCTEKVEGLKSLPNQALPFKPACGIIS